MKKFLGMFLSLMLSLSLFSSYTISLRVNDDESKLIHDYVSVNQLNMSQFIRDAVLDKIENDLDLDEDRILYAFEKAKQEKTYDHTEVWKMLGV